MRSESMIEKYILYVPYRWPMFAGIHCYEALSECGCTGCIFNKGGCILFGKDDRTVIKKGYTFFFSMVHKDCPRVERT